MNVPSKDIWQCLEIILTGTTWKGAYLLLRDAFRFYSCVGETFITKKKKSVLKVSTTEAEEGWYMPSQQPLPGVQG